MYQEILNGMGVNVTPSALRQVPGGAILMDLRVKPNDLDSLFDAFCHHFRNVRPWVWRVRFLTEVEVNAIGRSGYQGPFSTLPGKASEGLKEGNVRLLSGEYLAKVKRANK